MVTPEIVSNLQILSRYSAGVRVRSPIRFWIVNPGIMYQRNGDGGAFLVILGIVVSHLDELKEE